jgi:cobalt-zinc-cadmium efflux system outer membrane protein
MLFLSILLGSAGCAVQDYSPPLLPMFMQEQDAALHTVLVLPGPSIANSSRDMASVSDAPQRAESLSPHLSEIRSHGLTLEQAIHTVLEADPQIQVGMEAIRQAQADLLTASLPPNPELSTLQTLLPLGRPFRADTREGGPPQFDVELSYPIDWFLFGKRAAAITSARLGIEVSVADFAEVVRHRVAEAIAAFYSVLEAQAVLTLAWEDLESVQRTEEITQQLVAIGGAGTIELDRIRLAVIDSQREVRRSETALAAAMSQLRALLGFPDFAPALMLRGDLEVSTPAPPLTPEDALTLAEQHRPDLISLRRQLVKAETDVVVEQKNIYPEVTPMIGYTRQFQREAIGFPDVNAWGIGVGLTVPLFDRNQGNIAKAQSVRTQTQLHLRAQLLELQAEVEQAVQAYRAAYQTVTTDDPVQLQAAQNVRDKIQAAYELGARPLIEVLDAQRAYRETRRRYLEGQAQYWQALHQLNATIGTRVLP